MTPMIMDIKGLTKSYANIQALHDFNYIFTNGVYGILGPNGAGKTTLIKIVAQNLKADKGEIYCQGKPCTRAFLMHLGIMPQQQELYPKFSVEEFMFYMAALKGMKRKQAIKDVAKLLGVVSLTPYRYRKIESLSGGMKQRLLIAQALLNDPEVLLFDEPTAGLDPTQRIEIRNFLATLSKDHIVIITTHVVSDVETIADHILLMKNGSLVKSGSPEVLCDTIYGKVKEIELSLDELLQFKENKYSIIGNHNGKKVVRIITDQFFSNEKIIYPSLEDVYLYYIGEK